MESSRIFPPEIRLPDGLLVRLELLSEIEYQEAGDELVADLSFALKRPRQPHSAVHELGAETERRHYTGEEAEQIWKRIQQAQAAKKRAEGPKGE